MEEKLTPIIKDSFLNFAGAVLQSRALSDARDNMKPSARQIFYCMYTDKFVHSKPFQKTLKSIGSAFRMYIHGDASAEGVIMRAGQPFSMRYPLVEVEGSYGTLIASGSWAAPRYTGARLSELAEYLFADLKKDVVSEWRDNYDNTEQYPMVLPSKGFYNLVNGNFGLGVGASSSIPQYNLRELNEALITLLQNPDCSFDKIYCAPDFATGATIINGAQVKASHKNGTGFACRIRSTVEWDQKERAFVVTEIPYMVYTETICKELEELINSEDNPGIERFNDLTGQKPLIKIYLTKKANPDKILKFLYKNTSLQSFYGINFTMLDNGRYPKIFTWKEMLQAHIDHEKEVYRRGFEFDLKKINDRIHIIDGLLVCMARIEEVVQTIKTSTSTAAASIALQSKFLLDGAQAKAVLDMKLSRLAHLEVKKLEDEKHSLEVEGARIMEILNNKEKFDNELITGWREVARKFGDERRTKIIDLTDNENSEPIEEKQLLITFTNNGAVYISETSSLYTQRRNGVGAKFKLDKGEYIVDSITCKNTDTLMFFTSHGSFYHLRADNFAIGDKQYLSNFVTTLPYEHIINASTVTAKKYIIFVTKHGIIKKTEFAEYNLKRNTGAIAIKLDEGDEIMSVLFVEDENIGIASKSGNFIIIKTTDINAIGRVARGVIGMKVNEGGEVINARIINNSCTEIVSVSSDGYIKRTPISEFKITGRGTKGVKLQRTDDLCDFIPSNGQDDVNIISLNSQLRLKVTDIPSLSRGAQGVKSIKLSENSKVIKLTAL